MTEKNLKTALIFFYISCNRTILNRYLPMHMNFEFFYFGFPHLQEKEAEI